MITTLVNDVIKRSVYEIGCKDCREILLELWETIGAKEVWPEIGRLHGFQESEVLQHEMHGGTQNKVNSDKRIVSEQGEEDKNGSMRRMWFQRKSTEASSRLLKARIDKSALSKLSCECPSCRWIMGELRDSGVEGLSNMQEGSCTRERGREKGVLPNKDLLTGMWLDIKKTTRVDRLRLLGNGVVPQQACRAYQCLTAPP
jgi:hypothetical protein